MAVLFVLSLVVPDVETVIDDTLYTGFFGNCNRDAR